MYRKFQAKQTVFLHLTSKMFVCGVDYCCSLTVLLPITVMSALELASLKLQYVLYFICYFRIN